MKHGESADENEINCSVLKIPHLYLMDVYRNLFDDGFLTGTCVTEDMSGNVYIENLSLVRITTKGIEYLEDNSKMKQAYKILKEIKDWIPGM